MLLCLDIIVRLGYDRVVALISLSRAGPSLNYLMNGLGWGPPRAIFENGLLPLVVRSRSGRLVYDSGQGDDDSLFFFPRPVTLLKDSIVRLSYAPRGEGSLPTSDHAGTGCAGGSRVYRCCLKPCEGKPAGGGGRPGCPGKPMGAGRPEGGGPPWNPCCMPSALLGPP